MDNVSGCVCAHVLAWSPRNKTAYIAPMEVLLDDMAQTLGAKVTLPRQESPETIPSPKKSFDESMLDRLAVSVAPGLASIAAGHKPRPHSYSHPHPHPHLHPQGGSSSSSSSPIRSRKQSPPQNYKIRQQHSTQNHHHPCCPSQNSIDDNDNDDNVGEYLDFSPPKPTRKMVYPTPSPSPPLVTSPPGLPLIDNVARQRFPNTDVLRHVSTKYAPQSRRDMLDSALEGCSNGRGMVGMRGRGVKTKG